MKNKKATKTIETLESFRRERVRVHVCVRDLTYYVFARDLKKKGTLESFILLFFVLPKKLHLITCSRHYDILAKTQLNPL